MVPNKRQLAEQAQRIVELETERALLKGVIAEQARQLAEQTQQIAEQAQRITELEAKLAQNSTNSSRPPSSDRPKTSKKPRKRRKGKRRRRGGQPGHKGHGRALVPLSEVSKIVPLRPSQCSCCQHELEGTDPEPHRHQVTELPPIQPIVTEYQLHRLRCSECGTTTRAELPKDVPRGSFGPRLQAVVALASGVYRMPKRMIESFFSDSSHGAGGGLDSGGVPV